MTTGAQREHRLDRLMDQAHAKGLSDRPLAHYYNLFRYGCPPHGGCGIGLIRMLMFILDRKNVREVTYLHRAPDKLEP